MNVRRCLGRTQAREFGTAPWHVPRPKFSFSVVSFLMVVLPEPEGVGVCACVNVYLQRQDDRPTYREMVRVVLFQQACLFSPLGSL